MTVTLDKAHVVLVGNFNAVSLRNRDGNPLGNFRWILIEGFPVSDKGEHTAFQEICIEP